MYRISKRFEFSASHILNGLPDGHQCGRLHGHNYVVEVELSGEPGDVGFVLDYGELAPIKRFIDETYDHRHLNDEMAVNPTAENLAREICAMAEIHLGILDGYNDRWRISAVRVMETPKTMAEYRP